MSPDALKKRVVEEFHGIGLLEFLDVETSAFRELPRFFEASHLSMQLVLENAYALAAATAIAARMKRELEEQSVELEYEIRVQWKLASINCGTLERTDLLSTAVEDLEAQLESGAATRSVSIHVSPAARICILQYVAQFPPAERPDAIRNLLQDWISGQLSTEAQEYWDPVLYPSRNIDEKDIAGLCIIREGLSEPEPASKA